MGLFSSKRKVAVAAASVPLMDREVDLLGESLMRSILRKNDISSGLVDSMVNGSGRNIVRAYNYAKSDYHYGLPNGTAEVINYSESALIAAVEASTGDTVLTLLDVLHDSGNPGIEANWYLDTVRNRSLLTGELATLPPTLITEINSRWNTWVSSCDTTLTSHKGAIEASYPQTTTYIEEDSTDTNNNPCTKNVQDVVTVNAESFSNGSYSHKTHVDDIDYLVDGSGYPTGHEYTYTTREHFALAGVVSYELSTVRTVTPEYDDGTFGAPYVEFVPNERVNTRYPFSANTAHVSTETTSLGSTYDFRALKYYVQYTLADGLVKSWMYDTNSNVYLELDYVSSVGSESPFYPVVPLRRDNTDYCHPDEWDTVRYLTSKKLLNIIGVNIQDLREGINENPNIDDIDHAYFMFGVQLQDESQAAKRYLGAFFEHMDSVLPAGEQSQSIRITEGGLDMRLSWDNVDTTIHTGRIGTKGTANSVVNTTANQMVFRTQFDEDSYKEVTVTGLLHTNYIYEDKTVETTLADTLEDGEYNFIIPLHASVVDNLPVVVRNELYYDAMQLVFYSYEVTHVAWYRQEWFLTLIKIVSVIITIASLGTMAKAGYTAFTAATAAGATAVAGLGAAVQVLLLQLFEGMVTSFLFKLAVAQVDPDFAMIASALMLAYSGIKGFQAGGFVEGSTAEMLLKVSTGISYGVQQNLAQATLDLKNEVDVFSKDADQKMDALDEINKEFALTGIIDPMEFIMTEPTINLNESPESYYFRTVHSGNIGAMAYDAITKYHDTMLDLPQPQHTYI
jgi:hypothetical protein